MSKMDNPWKAMIFVSVIGVDLAICVLGGFWLGRYLDNQFATAPLFLLIGLLMGLAAGIFSIYNLIRSFFGEN